MTLFSILGHVVMSGVIVIALAAAAGYASRWMDAGWSVHSILQPRFNPTIKE